MNNLFSIALKGIQRQLKQRAFTEGLGSKPRFIKAPESANKKTSEIYKLLQAKLLVISNIQIQMLKFELRVSAQEAPRM